MQTQQTIETKLQELQQTMAAFLQEPAPGTAWIGQASFVSGMVAGLAWALDRPEPINELLASIEAAQQAFSI